MRLGGPLGLNLLRVFVAIYEARSVTHAAERLEVTQPTISHGLAKITGHETPVQ
jgi:DNA-binding transcriptional LysR family regulator